MVESTYRARALLPQLELALSESPVAILVGPRQSGKSTLARQLVPAGSYTTLDDPEPLAFATADPDGFIARFKERCAIDEVQKVPDLMRAIKASVDRDRRPGRFLLTGSADVLVVPRVAESLAGRMRLLTLWPFAEAELAGSAGDFVDRLFDDGEIRADAVVTRADAVDRAVRGGYPEIIQMPISSRSSWYESYIAAVTLRDIRDIVDVRGLTQLPGLLRLLAARTCAVLNIAELSRISGIPQTTVARYLSLLQLTFLLRLMPSWSGSLAKRLTRHPKIAICDTGLAAHLQGVETARLAVDQHLAGALLENYVLMELEKQSSWSRTRPALYHFRSGSGDEVDIVMERRDGSVVGIEVKASVGVTAADFRGLRALSLLVKRKFVRGIVLHPGRNVVGFSERLSAVPLSALWT